jgi:WD40 repeat protein
MSASTVCVWSLEAGRRRAATCHPQAGSITDATFSPGGSRFVSVSDSGSVAIRSANGRWLAGRRRGAPINSVSFSSDGRHIVTAGDDRQARIWSAGGHLEHVLAGHTDAVTSARFSPKGDQVLTGSADGSARVWSAIQGDAPLRGALADAEPVFSPDGRRLLAVDPQGRALVWDLASRTPVQLHRRMPVQDGVAPPCGRATGCMPWSRDSRTIAGVDAGYAPTVWDARRGRPTRLGGFAVGAAFMPDMRVLVMGNRGGRIVDPASPCAPTCAAVPTRARIDSVGFSTTGQILTVSQGRMQVWPVGPSRSGAVQAAAIAPDGRRIAAGTADGLEVYDRHSGARHSASQPPRDFKALMFDRAGKRILAVSSDRTARVWDADHPERRPRILRHGSDVLSAEFSPSEGLVLTAAADGRARVWDPADEATLLEIRTSRDGGAQFSPDGRTIAVGGVDTVHLISCEICAPFDQLVRRARARLP